MNTVRQQPPPQALSRMAEKSTHEELAVFSSSEKQCFLSVNLKPFLMQTEQQTPERRIVAGEDMTPKNPLERRTPT